MTCRRDADKMVTDPDVLAPDLIFVVQRGVGDVTPPTNTGAQPRHRSQRAGTSRPARLISSTCVISSCAGYLCAKANRGARDTNPRRAWLYRSLTCIHPVDFERQCLACSSDCAVVAQEAVHALDDSRAVSRKMLRLQIVELVAVEVIGYFAFNCPNPYAKKVSAGRLVMRESSWRSAPADALRGLANSFSPDRVAAG